MKSSKRMREPRWFRLLFSVFDKSIGYCVGDFLEDYEAISVSRGKLRAIGCLCREIVLSAPYLGRGLYLTFIGWCTGSWRRVIGRAKLVRTVSNSALSSFLTSRSVVVRVSALSVLLALCLSIFYFYSVHQKTATLEEELARFNSIDSNVPAILLSPSILMRSTGEPITRLEIDFEKVIALKLQLPDHEEAAMYQVTLTRIDGDVLNIGNLKRLKDNSLSVILPTSLISPTDYRLTVYGLTPSQDRDSPVCDYFFRVVKGGGQSGPRNRED